MKRRMLLAVLAAMPLFAAGVAMAKGPRREAPDLEDVVFSEIERRLIREYYAQRASAAGQDSLPPGIRKKLARGKPLPPGIAKRMLPPDLDAHLPVRAGVVRQVIGSDVVLIAVATNIVLDILFDVIKH